MLMEHPSKNEYRLYFRPFELFDRDILHFADTNSLTIWKNRRCSPSRLLLRSQPTEGEMIEIRADWPDGQMPMNPPLVNIDIAMFRILSEESFVRTSCLKERYPLFENPALITDLLNSSYRLLMTWEEEWDTALASGVQSTEWKRIQPRISVNYFETMWPEILKYLSMPKGDL